MNVSEVGTDTTHLSIYPHKHKAIDMETDTLTA